MRERRLLSQLLTYLAVLVLVVVTLAPLVWLFIQSSFIKKIRPASNVTMLYILGFVMGVVGYGALMISAMQQSQIGMALSSLLYLGSIVTWIIAVFKARSLLVEYYNTVEPISLRLSGVMTFFFSIYYFQYHFTRIADWKRTGVLRPQG